MRKELVDHPGPTKSTFFGEWTEVESGHFEIILDFEPAPKPKVHLPAITNGIINTSTVRQLQDRLGNAEAELKRLKEGATQHIKHDS